MRHPKHGRLTDKACEFLRALSINPCCTGYFATLRGRWILVFSQEMALDLAERKFIEEIECKHSPRFTRHTRAWKLTEEGSILAKELCAIRDARNARDLAERDIETENRDSVLATVARNDP